MKLASGRGGGANESGGHLQTYSKRLKELHKLLPFVSAGEVQPLVQRRTAAPRGITSWPLSSTVFRSLGSWGADESPRKPYKAGESRAHLALGLLTRPRSGARCQLAKAVFNLLQVSASQNGTGADEGRDRQSVSGHQFERDRSDVSNDSVLVDSSWLQLAGFGVNPTEFGLSTAVNLLQEEVQKREEGGRKAGRRRPGRLAGHTSPWPVKKSSYVGDFTETGRVARAARVFGVSSYL